MKYFKSANQCVLNKVLIMIILVLIYKPYFNFLVLVFSLFSFLCMLFYSLIVSEEKNPTNVLKCFVINQEKFISRTCKRLHGTCSSCVDKLFMKLQLCT